MFFRLAVSSSSKRARGASNFNSAILPAMSLIIEREGGTGGATGEFGVAAERGPRFRNAAPRTYAERTAVYPTRSREPRRRRQRDRNMQEVRDEARAHTIAHTDAPARARARVCSRTRGTRSKRARDSRQHNPRRHERTDCERLSWTVERRGPAPLRCSSLTTVVWWWRVTLDSRGWWEDDRAGRHSNRWLSAPMSRIISLRQGRPYRSKPFTFRDLFTEFTHIHGPI